MRDSSSRTRAILSQETVATVHGPIDRSFRFQRGQKYAKVETASERNRDNAIKAVKLAVQNLAITTQDWDDRSSAERERALERVKLAGINLFTTFVSAANEIDFLKVFDGVSFLGASTDTHVPWEWIYLGARDALCDPMKFLGARIVVGQSSPFSTTSPNEVSCRDDLWDRFNKSSDVKQALNYESGFGVRVAEDERLRSAALGLERAIFSDHGIPVQVLGSLTPGSAGEKKKYFSFINDDQDLSHFNCHGGDDELSLYVSSRYLMTVQDFLDSGHLIPEGSAVVLNCCNSMTTRYDEDPSLARAFEVRGAGVVVGTTGVIDDTYATLFARAFYERYLKCETAGTALLGARIEVIQSTNNPACLVYSLLGGFKHKLDAAVA
jgi:hypothetical protein